MSTLPGERSQPFYTDYAAADLQGEFVSAGLRPLSGELAFLSKVMVFDKPEAG